MPHKALYTYLAPAMRCTLHGYYMHCYGYYAEM